MLANALTLACYANAVFSALGSVSSTSTVSCLGRIIGDNWTGETARTESWTGIAPSTTVWTVSSEGSEPWTGTTPTSTTWTTSSGSNNSWVNN